MVTLLVFRPDLNWPLIRASGVSAVFPLLCPADPRLAAFLTKIAFSNALPMSLALALWAAFPDPREGKRSEFVLGALVAGCLGFHLATGLLLLAGLLTRWGVEKILALRGNRTANAVPMRPLLFAMVLAAPYAISVMSARESPAATWTWQGSRSLELHLALIGIWILTLPVWREWLGRPDTRAWILTGVPALILPFVVHLVDGNEYKSLFFLLGILALPAAAGLARITRERRAWVALILLVFLPTSVITAWICGTEIPPGHLDSAERHRVSEMTRDLPVESVIWIPDPARAYETLTVFLGKPCYLSDPYPLQIMGQWDGEEAWWRRASLALAGTRETVPRALASAQSRVPRRPLYALVTSETARRYPHLIPALEALRLEAIPGEGFQLYPIPSPEEPPKTP